MKKINKAEIAEILYNQFKEQFFNGRYYLTKNPDDEYCLTYNKFDDEEILFYSFHSLINYLYNNGYDLFKPYI